MEPGTVRQLYQSVSVAAEEAEPSGSSPCSAASEFLEWIQREIAPLLDADPSIIEINQAYLSLVHNWMIRRWAANRGHRDLSGTRGHPCLFSVFEATYHQIQAVEANLAISKRTIPTPQPKPPPPVPQPRMPDLFAGMPVSEETDE
ncbi:hypothetical protein [Nitrolancea hollandica]|uniref:Uncharacterized protein n=1 Tax=Nitrolancea hollandica Lb TaxID=1129897 RepID=I4ELA8_9BACT|nr:hypothetical protein [Nitrolancea hollandica]CCF85470.1 hypothetical protein NITHO_500005 [Nitrolancea hollandica Lb]